MAQLALRGEEVWPVDVNSCRNDISLAVLSEVHFVRTSKSPFL